MSDKKNRAISRLSFIVARMLNTTEIDTIRKRTTKLVNSALYDQALPQKVRCDINNDILHISREGLESYVPSFLTPEIIAFNVNKVQANKNQTKRRRKQNA